MKFLQLTINLLQHLSLIICLPPLDMNKILANFQQYIPTLINTTLYSNTALSITLNNAGVGFTSSECNCQSLFEFRRFVSTSNITKFVYGQSVMNDAQGKIFGSQSPYIAQKLNNQAVVIVSSLNKLSENTTFCTASDSSIANDYSTFKQPYSGTDIQIGGTKFKIFLSISNTASKSCFIITYHLIDAQSFVSTKIRTIGNGYYSCLQIMSGTNHFHLTAQLATSKDPSGGGKPQALVDLFTFTIFKDIENIPYQLSNSPFILANMALYIPQLNTFVGGDTGQTMMNQSNNVWVTKAGACVFSNTLNKPIPYSNNTITYSADLGPTNWGSYFTYNYKNKIFFGAYQIAPMITYNSEIDLTSQFDGTHVTSAVSTTGSFVNSQITYYYSYMASYKCGGATDQIFNSIVFYQNNNLGLFNDFLDQNNTSNSKTPNQKQVIKNPRLVFYYLFYVEPCTSTFSSTAKYAQVQNLLNNFFITNQGCIYSCVTCLQGISTQCYSCTTTSFRTYNSVSFSCLCNSGYYDDGSSDLCKKCVDPCLTCSSQTNCLSCYASHFRTVVNGQCACNSSAVDLGAQTSWVCQKCHYSCATCNAQIQPSCATCNTSNFRIKSGNLCICNGGYYDDGVNGACKLCDYSCGNCSVQSTQCTSCIGSQRILLSSKCVCNDGYFDNGVSSCATCSSVCKTCVTTSTTCTSCVSTQFRVLNVSSCICQQNYTLNSSSICVQATAIKCDPSCQTCTSTTATSCTSCNITNHRILSSGSCLCQSGYLSNTDGTCGTCQYTCLTCTATTSCTTCQTNRFKPSVNSFCLCNENYYEDTTQICVKCGYSCLNCTNSTFCTVCPAQRVYQATTGKCLCLQGQYDDGLNQVCASCDARCVTCTSATICQSCAINRFLDQNDWCQCNPGYYEQGTSCTLCGYKCLTCSSATTCITCPQTRSLDNFDCDCNNGFYDAGSSTCASCSFKCLSCSDFDVCTSCPSSRTQSGTTCNCADGYYDTNNGCISCDDTCQTCQSDTICTSCVTGRTLSNNSCICISGQYEDSSGICQQCGYTCGNCSSIYVCIDCQPQRTLSNGLCICNDGYFDVLNQNCQSCPSICTQCTSGGCSSCIDNALVSISNLCQCNEGFYYDQSQCQSCDLSCKTCIDSVSCQTCQIEAVINISNLCSCINGYFFDASYNCVSCPQSCTACISLTNCQSCATNRELSNDVCICQIGYYEIDQSTCGSCNFNCKSCQTYPTQCLSCYGNLSLINNQCTCQTRYYMDVQNQLCLQCNLNCQICENSANNCSSCLGDQRNTSDSCECNFGYIDVVGDCTQCSYECSSCFGGISNCTSCQPNRNLSNLCSCNQGYFEQNQTCVNCDPNCKSCSIASNNCTECIHNLQDLTNSCRCQQGYFQDGTDCKQCDLSCLECSIANSCTICKPYRNISNQCQCEQRYYEHNNSCELCSDYCQTCSVIKTNCTSCISPNRNLSNQCLCENGYYAAGFLCSKCDLLCSTCSSSIQCDTCISDNRLPNICTCQPGYYEYNQECQRCSYKCVNCLQTASSCVDCVNLRNISNYCNCNFGYFEQNNTCLICHSKCASCSNSDRNCTSCSRSFSDVNNSCECLSGYTEINNLCDKCAPQCKNCFGSINNCTDCTLNRNISNNCKCSTSYFELNDTCKLCDIRCETCYGAKDNCTSCKSLNRVVMDICRCADGYYESGKQCVACNNNCSKCTSELNCTECRGLSRILEQQCQCVDGYFEDQIKTCQKCSIQCLNCFGKSDYCVSCSSQSRNLNNKCNCKDGYYETNQTECGGNSQLKIIVCKTNCATCNNNQTCLSCFSQMQRIDNQCLCAQSQYQNGLNCYNCSTNCLECSSYDVCTACNQTQHRFLNMSKCDCRYDHVSVKDDCFPYIPLPNCSYAQCLRCDAQDHCTLCSLGYYVDDQYQCSPCDDRCLYCNGASKYNCTKCKYTMVNQTCAFCEEAQGLYTSGFDCKYRCGDGLWHKETEECDDGNKINTDSCSNNCRLIDPGVHAYLNCLVNTTVYSEKKYAELYFSSSLPTNHMKWEVELVGYQSKYQIEKFYQERSVTFQITFQKSVRGIDIKILNINNSIVYEKEFECILQDYIHIEKSIKKATQELLDVNEILTKIVIGLMLFCILTGGFDMISNIMDLFQVLSYIKYLNVQYPFNLMTYFDFMGQFNYQVITQRIPFIGNLRSFIGEGDLQPEKTVAPYKFWLDGYNTLFLQNFAAIFLVWVISIFTVILSKILVFVLSSQLDVEGIQNSSGFKLKLLKFRFRLVTLLICLFQNVSQSFITTGMLRVFLSSAYDFNFALALELSNLHFTNANAALIFSSLFCLTCTALQIILVFHLLVNLKGRKGQELQGQQFEKEMGSILDGISFNRAGPIKYSNLIQYCKKMIFMFFLVLLYETPEIQLFCISGLYLSSFLFDFLFHPLDDRDENFKANGVELIVSIISVTSYIFLYEQEILNQNIPLEINVGWFLIGLCLYLLATEIVLDVKKNLKNIVEAWNSLQKYLDGRHKKKTIKNIDEDKTIEPEVLTLKKNLEHTETCDFSQR